jgi:ubiquinone/menaquinone biosynthesis C-methylase UbiE
MTAATSATRPAGTGNEAGRTSWVEKKLRAIPAGSRLLDAGAGEQRYRSCCGHLQYVAQDFGRYDGQGDSAGLQTGGWKQDGLHIVGDLVAIPEPSASFDAILCTEVLEHVPEPIAAIAEFGRLLRPGGQLLLTAPFCSLTHFSPFHYYTGFNRYFYETELPPHGFRIVELTSNGNFFEYLAQELGRLDSVARRYAGRRLGRLDILGVRLLLHLLGRLSRSDGGSAELLNFGYFVHAIKV